MRNGTPGPEIATAVRRWRLIRGVSNSLDQHTGREPRTATIEVEQLADALEKLEALSPRKADIVKMRVIWGLTLEQIAKSLDVSPSTVDRDWRFSKAWLAEEVRLA